MMVTNIFHLYGLFLWLGFMIAIFVVEKKISKIQLPLKEHFSELLVWILIGGIIGARLYHLATDWSLYAQSSFFSYIAIWNGGLGIIGGIFGGIIALALYVIVRRSWSFVTFFSYLDSAAFGLPLGQAVGRFGNAVNQELYGLPTTLPWKIFIDESHRMPGYETIAYYHPLFLYESLILIGVWMILFWLNKQSRFQIGSGRLFGMYLLLYGIGRFALEFFRIHSSTVGNGQITTAQLVSFFGMMVGIGLICKKHTHGTLYEHM